MALCVCASCLLFAPSSGDTTQKLGLTGTTDIYLSFVAAHYICSVLRASVLCTYENAVAVAQHNNVWSHSDKMSSVAASIVTTYTRTSTSTYPTLMQGTRRRRATAAEMNYA